MFSQSDVSDLKFALEPLLPKKMHARSQDKLDKDGPEREKKEKKKEKKEQQTSGDIR